MWIWHVMLGYYQQPYFVSRVLVLVDGRVCEFDRPRVLMADDNSVFRAMVQKAGISDDKAWQLHEHHHMRMRYWYWVGMHFDIVYSLLSDDTPVMSCFMWMFKDIDSCRAVKQTERFTYVETKQSQSTVSSIFRGISCTLFVTRVIAILIK